jgi:4-hydroxy-tetrahydrodipicolinate reductase
MITTTSKHVFSQKKDSEMNIALIGYGRMGHEIEAIALKRGHTMKLIIDLDNATDLNEKNLKGIDAAIEFSSPDSAFANVSECLKNGVPVVSGTTGWQKDLESAVSLCKKHNTSFIHTTNFSIGVNLLFLLNRELAKRISRYNDYSVSIEEIHHTKKLDAPSGTAITLADGITVNHKDYNKWCFKDKPEKGSVPIESIREGLVPGTHTVSWESDIDTISLKHEAKNRKGFALGAVVAAEFISTRKGVFTMSDVMGF